MNAPYLTTGQAAHIIQRAPDYISAMKRKGYKPILEALNLHALDGPRGLITWLNEHPEFRYRDAYPSKRKRKSKQSERLRTSPKGFSGKGVRE